MEQVKALNALEPFLALSKSATSPRAAAEIVTRATSSPNTFIFTELLQTPQIQNLSTSDEFAPHLTLLQIFSYGTYTTYKSTPALPPLTDPQTLKLRQLSLMTLAKQKANLTYTALSTHLGLADTRELEDTVISTIYAGLLTATLDPAHRRVQVSSVAPLRDLAPGAVPELLQTLKTWTARCDTTLADLENQIAGIRREAARRAREKAAGAALLAKAVEDEKAAAEGGGGKNKAMTLNTGRPARFGKRGSNLMMEREVDVADDEAMDVDEGEDGGEGKKRASRRKL